MLIQFLFSFLSTIAFGVITNVPRRTLLASGLTGAVGWMIYILLKQANFPLGFANFIAAFMIGCASIFFSRQKKIPMLISKQKPIKDFTLISLLSQVKESLGHQEG